MAPSSSSASCCRTCSNRNAAVTAHLSFSPQLLSVSLIVLRFKAPLPLTATDIHSGSGSGTSAYVALNTVLNNIVDAAENTTHPSRFTSWGPSSDDPSTVLIVTTLCETVTTVSPSSSSVSHSGRPTPTPIPAVFDPVSRFLVQPPSIQIQHVHLPSSAVALCGGACDILILRAPDSRIASAVGKTFGWDPKRSSLSAQLEQYAPAGFSSPGDLVRDFWAWTEGPGREGTGSPVSSYGGDEGFGRGALKSTNSDADENVRGPLRSTNSDEKNMAMFLPGDDEDEDEAEKEKMADADDETLVMIFQWSSRLHAERFKHPLQKSFGPNHSTVRPDLWDRDVANPVRQLEGMGAVVQHLKVELRGIEDRIGIEQGRPRPAAPRERSGSRRLSVMASGMGERLSGFWR